MAEDRPIWDAIKEFFNITVDPGGEPQASLATGYYADHPTGPPGSAAQWKASADPSYEVKPFEGPLAREKGLAAKVRDNMPDKVFSYETPYFDASVNMGYDAPVIDSSGNLSSGMDLDMSQIKETAGKASAYSPEGLKSTNKNPFGSYSKSSIPRSQQEAWYKYAEDHDVPDEYKGEFGYVNLLMSQDSDTIAQWAMDDPMMMIRLLNSGIDIADTENLSKNIYDYMWGDNPISLYDYMTAEGNYDLGDDAGMIAELGRYLTGSNYNYGFDPAFAKENNLTDEDVVGFMLAKQISNYGNRRMNMSQLNELLPQNVLGGGEIRFMPMPEEGLDENEVNFNALSYGNILDNEYIPEEVANAIVSSVNKTRGEGNPYILSFSGKKDKKG